MFRRAGAARVILTLLFLSACGGSEKPASSSQSPTPRATATTEATVVREVGEDIATPLAQAFQRADEKLLPELHPEVRPEGKELLTVALERAADFKLDRVSLRSRRCLRTGETEQRCELSGSYRMRDVAEDQPFSMVVYAEPDGNQNWRLKSVDWGREPIWSIQKPVRRTMTPAALVFHPPGFDAQEIGSLVGEARAKLGKALPDIGSKRYLVLVPADNSDFSEAGGGGAAAVSTLQTIKGREFEVTEPWLIVNIGNWEDADAESRRTLILHEVTHAMLAPRTSPVVPNWVSEGIAVYYAGDPGLEEIRRDPELLDKTTMRDIAHSSFALKRHEYAMSGAAISTLVERHGEKSVLAFMESFDEEMTDEEVENVQDSMLPAATMEDITEEISFRLVPKTFGIDFDQLDVAAKEWIRARI